MACVSIEAMCKSYGSVRAVNDVTIEVAQGEFFFLLGPSGCGKTTLLRIIAGFCEPEAGRLQFDERVMDRVPPHRRNTGMVFQNYALWPHMTVRENVAYGLKVRRLPRAEVRRRTDGMLELVRMAELADRRPNALSGGQQQRVALARALVIEPDVLLLDEPLSNLDARLRVDMRKELRRIHRETGVTTIYVTHDQKEALSLAQRIAVMRDGRVEQVGAPQDVYLKPRNRFVAEFIGQANIIVGQVREQRNGECLVETGLGLLKAAGNGSGAVLCCIRPEALRLEADEAENRLRVRVDDATYLGDQEQVTVQATASDGTLHELLLLRHHPTAGGVRPGAEVTLGFGSKDVVLLPDEPPPA